MELVIIVAMAANRVIGKDQKIPWHISSELQHFKKTTWGYPLIMGRKTYDSIGRPLPGRKNIIISRNRDLLIPGCEVYYDLDRALQGCKSEKKAFVIGGAQIFTKALPLVDTIILTTIPQNVSGDTFFPPLPEYFVLESTRKVGGTDPFVIDMFRRT